MRRADCKRVLTLLLIPLMSFASADRAALAANKSNAARGDKKESGIAKANVGKTAAPEEAPGASAPKSAPITDKWALVVGISKFKDPSLNLRYAAKDATDFRNFLVNDAGFAPDHVHLLVDEHATKEQILKEFGDKWLPRVARPNDLVVLYFSTHGSPSEMDIRGVNYIVTHDTMRDSLFSTGLAMREVVEAINERINSKRILVIMDACHSGAATTEHKGLVRQSNFDAAAIAQGTGQMVICSSQPSEVTWESKNYQNGVFTRHLIEGLREKDGHVTLEQAFKLIQNRVQEEVLRDRGEVQSPVLSSKWSGEDLILAVKPTDPKPGLSEPSLAETGQSGSAPQTDAGAAKDGAVTTAAPTEDKATTATEKQAISIAGNWDSNWGPITFEHDPITGNGPVEVTGHWQQGPKKMGVFKTGSYDPATGVVKLTYYQNWNYLHGSAKFTINKKGNRMDGYFRQALILSGTWIAWR